MQQVGFHLRFSFELFDCPRRCLVEQKQNHHLIGRHLNKRVVFLVKMLRQTSLSILVECISG